MNIQFCSMQPTLQFMLIIDVYVLVTQDNKVNSFLLVISALHSHMMGDHKIQ